MESSNIYTTYVFTQLKRIIIVLFGFGLLLGNPIFLYVAVAFALVIIFDSASFFFITIHANTHFSGSAVRRGADVKITTDISFSRGIGIVKFFLQLPESFEIIDGTNYRLFFVLPWSQRVQNVITVNARKRGEYEIQPAIVEIISIWGEFERKELTSNNIFKIAVRPHQHLIKRLKEIKTVGKKPYPENSIVFLGIRSNSFKELRGYRSGDLMRWINWHVSAKALSSSASQLPLVNEYEVEGKKVVWIFVDNSVIGAVGSEVENVFEYFLDAALSTALYFISRGYKVGLSIFASNILIRSDTGVGQTAKILKEFVKAEYIAQKGDLVRAVESVKPFLVSERPLCFFLTRPEVDTDETQRAIRRLRAILGYWSKVYLLAVNWVHFHPEQSSYDAFVSQIMETNIKNALITTKKSGATPILWNPKKQHFGELLSRVIAVSTFTKY